MKAPKSRKLYKITLGPAGGPSKGYCYVIADSMRHAMVKAREEFNWLDAWDNHVLEAIELNDRVVE